MKWTPVVGERVAVYGYGKTSDCRLLYYNGDRGLVSEISYGGVEVKLDDGEFVLCHYKQCRRLKKKSEPRRIWVSKAAVDLTLKMGFCHNAELVKHSMMSDKIEFIEVISK